MLPEHRGRRPVVPSSAYVAPSAVLCGAATLGENSRVLRGAVLTAEDGEVSIGRDTVVMENALVRGRSAHPAAGAGCSRTEIGWIAASYAAHRDDTEL